MNSENNNNKNVMTPALAERIIKLQEDELLLRNQEIELKKQNQQYNYEFAKESLAVNERDQDNERKHKIQDKKINYWFFGVVFFIFIIFILVALYLNKDEVVKEIIKAIIYIATAGTGGYFYGKSKSTKPEE